MKKLFVVLLFFLFIFVISACVHINSKTNTNKISTANLSRMDTAILSTDSDNPFVYKYYAGAKDTKLSVWIEKYKKGKLVNPKLAHLSSEVRNNGYIILTLHNEKNDTSHTTFHIGINSGRNTMTTSVEDNDATNMSSFEGRFQGVKSIRDGEVVLGGIASSKDKDSSTSFRLKFYKNPSEMKKFNIVYIFKAKFL